MACKSRHTHRRPSPWEGVAHRARGWFECPDGAAVALPAPSPAPPGMRPLELVWLGQRHHLEQVRKPTLAVLDEVEAEESRARKLAQLAQGHFCALVDAVRSRCAEGHRPSDEQVAEAFFAYWHCTATSCHHMSGSWLALARRLGIQHGTGYAQPDPPGRDSNVVDEALALYHVRTHVRTHGCKPFPLSTLLDAE